MSSQSNRANKSRDGKGVLSNNIIIDESNANTDGSKDDNEDIIVPTLLPGAPTDGDCAQKLRQCWKSSKEGGAAHNVSSAMH